MRQTYTSSNRVTSSHWLELYITYVPTRWYSSKPWNFPIKKNVYYYSFQRLRPLKCNPDKSSSSPSWHTGGQQFINLAVAVAAEWRRGGLWEREVTSDEGGGCLRKRGRRWNKLVWLALAASHTAQSSFCRDWFNLAWTNSSSGSGLTSRKAVPISEEELLTF